MIQIKYKSFSNPYDFYRSVASSKRWILKEGYDFFDWYFFVQTMVNNRYG